MNLLSILLCTPYPRQGRVAPSWIFCFQTLCVIARNEAIQKQTRSLDCFTAFANLRFDDAKRVNARSGRGSEARCGIPLPPLQRGRRKATRERSPEELGQELSSGRHPPLQRGRRKATRERSPEELGEALSSGRLPPLQRGAGGIRRPDYENIILKSEI